jgi:hypothetical protein
MSACYRKMFLVLLNLSLVLTDWVRLVDVPYVNAAFPYKLWWNGGAVFRLFCGSGVLGSQFRLLVVRFCSPVFCGSIEVYNK